MTPATVLIAISAISATAYGLGYPARGTMASSIVKTIPVAALALAGAAASAPWPIVLGLALGALGDFLLSRHAQSAFLGGMGAFALGHIVYGSFLYHPEGMAQAWPLAAAMVALAYSTEIWLAPRTGSLRWPVRAYVVVITRMMVAALTLPAAQSLATTGAALFVISDVFLALELFVLGDGPRKELLRFLVWPAYWAGQFLLLLGTLG